MMPATPTLLTIDPNGTTVTVDIADVYAVSVTAYTASGGASTHSLPLAISTPTAFYLTVDGTYTVTALLAGVSVMSQAVRVANGSPVTVKVPYPSPTTLAALLAARAAVPASPTTYTQTYATAASTVPAATVAAVVTTAAGLASYGFTQAQADAIPVAVNALAADVLALKKVLTQIIDDLQAAGIAL